MVLTERGLWKLGDSITRIAQVAEKKSPFALVDIFCVAPLAVYRDELYAGGQRDRSLYRLVEGEAEQEARVDCYSLARQVLRAVHGLVSSQTR